MVLIVKKETGKIINDYLLKNNDFKSEQLFDTWRQGDGKVTYPPNCFLVLKEDNEYNFNADEEKPGYTNTYYLIDNQIVLRRTVEPEFVRQQIGWLEDELKKTDYKIIKAYEAQLIGESVSYDFRKVHEDRQVIRDKINKLEKLLTPEFDRELKNTI